MLREVIVERADEHEIVAISREPAAIGEQLKLDLAQRQPHFASSVYVLDSRPMAIDGAVFHRLRLKPWPAVAENPSVSAKDRDHD